MTTPPTEYRLELPDELNRLGLYLHSGFQQMTPAETLKAARAVRPADEAGAKAAHGEAVDALPRLRRVPLCRGPRQGRPAAAEGCHTRWLMFLNPTRKESNARSVPQAR